MKTRMSICIGIIAICILALCSVVSADTLPTLTLDPLNGAITGSANSTVGWGFTITNLGSSWAVVTSTDFCVGVITSPCSNSFGTYTDFAGPQFILVGPSPENSTFTQAFDNATQQGIGSFFINPSSVGTVFGQIVLTYDLFSQDPLSENFDPITDTESVGNYLVNDASVTVGTVTATPEPPSLLLLAFGVALVLIARRSWS